MVVIITQTKSLIVVIRANTALVLGNKIWNKIIAEKVNNAPAMKFKNIGPEKPKSGERKSLFNKIIIALKDENKKFAKSVFLRNFVGIIIPFY